MSYINMDHAGWVEREIKKPLSPFAQRVANILGIVGGGIYNCPINVAKINWGDPVAIQVVWSYRTMATWDFRELSALVVYCCQARIRCEIEACAPKRLRLTFHQRKPAESRAAHHPDIDEMVDRLRLPSDHPIIWWES